MTPRWRAYYTRERQFDSATHDWPDLPDDGVLAAKLWLDSGQQCIYGFDWYFLAAGIGHPIGNDDPKARNRERYDARAFKRGKWIDSADWRRLKREIQRDD